MYFCLLEVVPNLQKKYVVSCVGESSCRPHFAEIIDWDMETNSLLQVFSKSRWEGVYKIISSGIKVRNYGNMVERGRGKS